MSNNRSIKIANLPTTTPDKFIQIIVNFQDGGMNYFSSSSERKGFYLSVTPVEIKNGMVAFMMFSGIKGFNAKKLAAHAIAAPTSELLIKLVGVVLAKENLTLLSPLTPEVTPETVTVPAAFIAGEVTLNVRGLERIAA